ncbi:MAG: hypothetical protein PHD48_09410 [Alphaproteobacteria bacterium]|nr:hypothetical protein [Alphaproteobacteria bacterium]
MSTEKYAPNVSGDTASTTTDQAVAYTVGAGYGAQVTNIATHDETTVTVSMSENVPSETPIQSLTLNKSAPNPHLSAILGGIDKALNGSQTGPTPKPTLTPKDQITLAKIQAKLKSGPITQDLLSTLSGMVGKLGGLVPQSAIKALTPTPQPQARTVKNYTLRRDGQAVEDVAAITMGHDALNAAKEGTKDKTNSLEGKTPTRAPHNQIKLAAAVLSPTLYADEMRGEAPSPKGGKTKTGDDTARTAMMRQTPMFGLGLDCRPH